MAQATLNHLAIISIENKITADLNIEDMRLKFSGMKLEKYYFQDKLLKLFSNKFVLRYIQNF